MHADPFALRELLGHAAAPCRRAITGEPGVSLLNTLRALHLPLAQISLKVADSIASGAEKLEARVAAGTAESADQPTTVRVKPSRARAVEKA